MKYTVSMPEELSTCLNRGREESVSNDDVSIVCARKYEISTIKRVNLEESDLKFVTNADRGIWGDAWNALNLYQKPIVNLDKWKGIIV